MDMAAIRTALTLPMKLADLYDVTAFVDPAASKSPLKKQRAQAAIVVVAQDEQRHVFVRYSWARQCHTDELSEKIFDVNAKFLPRTFGAEANAMQILYGESLQREARQRGVKLPLVPVYQPPQQKKEWRIRAALQTLIAEGRLLLRYEDDELRQQLLRFPQALRVDLVDALASAVTLLPTRPLPAQRADARAGLASYLRASGIPPAEIARRLQVADRECVPYERR